MISTARASHLLLFLMGAAAAGACGGSGGATVLNVTVNGSGAVRSQLPPVECHSRCETPVAMGTTVALAAEAMPGWAFTGWSGACSGTDPCSVTMNGPQSVTATFASAQATLTVSKAGAGAGTVTSSPAGIDCGPTCTATFAGGTAVTLTATPAPGSIFVGWSGACTGAATCTVDPSEARTVWAAFSPAPVPATFVLTVTKTGRGAGTVVSEPSGIDCGATCAAPFAAGTQVTLTAAAAAGSTFAGWSGACSGAGVCRVTMDEARTVSATFAAPGTLTISRKGNGTVTSQPAGIDCGATCAGAFPPGASLTLIARPADGWRFVGWSSPCMGTGACELTVDADQTVTATFEELVTLSVSTAGNGRVRSTPAGIDCGSTCSASFAAGASVALAAEPAPGSTFVGWSGACTGTGTCTVALDKAASVTARFEPLYTLSVTAVGGGKVTASDSSIDCGATCQASYHAGAHVTLTAAPAPGAVFTGWSGACTGAGACEIAMDGHRAVTATFASGQALTVMTAGTGGGTVTSAPAGIACGATCVADFASGSQVTLTAAPMTGARFAGWSGDCAGSGGCTVTMSAARLVIATFVKTHELMVARTGTGAGTVTSTPAGITCGATCGAAFDATTMVTLVAQPGAGARFAGWSGACTGSGACTVTMDAAKAVTAEFRAAHKLTAIRSGGASMISSPAGIDCGNTCEAWFDAGTVVTLTSTGPFSTWFGDCTGSGACTVTMNADRTVGANFVLQLSVFRAGTGTGTVTSAPAGISCGASCTLEASPGSMVTLTPVAAAGSAFRGWSGACTGMGLCVVTLNASKSVTARFEAPFLTPTNISIGDGTIWTAAGHLDNDAHLDLVAVNSSGNTISVLQGNGDGTFGLPVDYAVGTNPVEVYLADVNGDGKLDALTPNSGTVAVLLGNGDGTFNAKIEYPSGGSTNSMKVGLFNNDAFLDIVTANAADDTVSIMLGNGNGSFGAPANFATNLIPISLAVADVNGDGKLDVVTANRGFDDVSVLLGDGNGGFASHSDFYAGMFPPGGIAIGDLDGDSKLDLVVTQANEVAVMLGNGSGSFGSPTNYATGTSPFGLTLGDVDGDGVLDILTAAGSSDAVSLLFGNGDGTFSTNLDLAVDLTPIGVTLADFDGDGELDLVTGNVGPFPGTISVLMHR